MSDSEAKSPSWDRCVSYRVPCQSREQYDKARSIVEERTQQDYVDSNDLWIEWVDGKRYIENRNDQFGDYFYEINIQDVSETEFIFTYHVRDNAGGYWKDMIVQMLSVLRDNGTEASIVRKEYNATE